ncbi:hypothetical protein D3C71_1711180 [compost metagenome]
MAQHLDLARGQVGVLRAGRARTHLASDADAELVADLFGGLEHLRAIRIANHLHQALAVSQIDEDHAAVVTPALYPAGQGHFLADQLFGHQTAVVSTHGGHRRNSR